MGSYLTTRPTVFVLMFSLAGAAACGPPPSSGGSSTCQSDDDCRADFACTRGRCRRAGSGAVDAGGVRADGGLVPGVGDTGTGSVDGGGGAAADAGAGLSSDAGNAEPVDASVAPSGCGDGVVDPGEGCDDGNRSNHDECTNACQRAACGDGWVRSGVETCDDGNRTSDDGCDSACQLEEQGDHGDTASEATPMFVPGQRQGALDRRDDLDFFVFVAPQTRRYFIETTQRTDTVCTLFASNGTQLAMDNNRGVSNNCAIMAELEADQTYRLRIHGSAGSMGSYRLHVNW